MGEPEDTPDDASSLYEDAEKSRPGKPPLSERLREKLEKLMETDPNIYPLF